MIAATLRRFATYNSWANHRLLQACGELSTEELAAPRTSFFPSLVATLNHILIVQWYYVDALEAGGRGRACFENEIPFREHAPLMEAQLASDRQLVAFADSLRDEDVTRIVDIPRRDHTQRETVHATMLHLCTHQIHHRGQVHAMLSGTKVKPPQLDDYFLAADLPLRESGLRELGLPLE
jgi:uncharacterized damage-inducible protein DinB